MGLTSGSYGMESVIVDGTSDCASGGCGVTVMGAESGVVTSAPMVESDARVPMGGTVMEGMVDEGAAKDASAAEGKPVAPSTAPKADETPKTTPAPQEGTKATPSEIGTEQAAPPTDAADESEMFDTDLPEAPDAVPPATDLDPAGEAPADQPATEETDNLFDQAHRSGVSVGSLAQGVRNWSDNTGRFGTVGTLVRIGDTFVRIQKSSGKLCTVPFNRLSDADYDYVQGLAGQFGLRLPIRLAAK